MADASQTRGGPALPTAYGHCAWHGGTTRDIRLIHIEQTGSGPGTGRRRFACHPCQIEHGLVPLADRP
ncbi:hypothetical protein ABZ341_02725 [Streptomyces sp. NPDC006173]|uniref:hypothetical protein n=1 Tax=Streptomyces sp. NPDC006173 TaxID=3155349 RepID=UPI0033FDF4BF